MVGANSGVGYATAKVIAQASEHFHVAIACRSPEKANNAISELKQETIEAQLSPVQLDVTDEQSIAQAAAHIQQQFGRLDVLINNAGIASQDPDLKTRFQQCLDTNVVGPVLVSAAFRDLLVQSPSPYSIYVSSALSSFAPTSDPSSGQVYTSTPWKAYSVSKAAVNMVAVQESMEVRSTAMKVFAVCPGLVRSNLREFSEEARSCWGSAGDPLISGRMVLDIIQGSWDEDAAGWFIRMVFFLGDCRSK